MCWNVFVAGYILSVNFFYVELFVEEKLRQNNLIEYLLGSLDKFFLL